MKNLSIYFGVSVLFLVSCQQPATQEKSQPEAEKDKTFGNWGRDFQLDNVNKQAVPWQDSAQEWVKAYRNYEELQPQAPANGQMKKVHGIAIDIEDVLAVLDPDDDGQYNPEVRKLYLMPALRDTVIEDSALKIFTLVMAPLHGAEDQTNVNTDMEVILSNNQAYDFYTICPPDCPTINWYGTDMPDDEAM